MEQTNTQTIDIVGIFSAVSGWILAIILTVKSVIESRNKRDEQSQLATEKAQAKKIEDQHKEDLAAHEILLKNQQEDRADKHIYEQKLLDSIAANINSSQMLDKATSTIAELKEAQTHLEDSQRDNLKLIEDLRKSISDTTSSYNILLSNYQALLGKFGNLQTKFDEINSLNQTLQAALSDSVIKINAMQKQIDDLVKTIQQSSPNL